MMAGMLLAGVMIHVFAMGPAVTVILIFKNWFMA
jgi:hypothetical protein